MEGSLVIFVVIASGFLEVILPCVGNDILPYYLAQNNIKRYTYTVFEKQIVF